MNLDYLRDALASDATRRAKAQERTIRELQAKVEEQANEIALLEEELAQGNAMLERAGLIKSIGAVQLLKYFWLSASFNLWDRMYSYCKRCDEKIKNRFGG